MGDVETDLFGADDDEPEVEAGAGQTQTQSQTQPAVRGFMADIFGDDDDDDVAIRGSGGGGNRDSDDELNDSSDEDVTSKRKSKLGKKKTTKEPKKKAKEPKKKGKEGKKRKQSETQVTSSGRISKKPTGPKAARDPNAPKADDGDEYDSEEDAVATKDDQNFLADEDDRELAGVVGEYEDDEQNFDDERPRKKAKGGGGGGRGGGGGGGGGGRDLDPFSETLQAMKKPKAVEINDTEKGRLAEELRKKMATAAREDDRLYREGKPAVHKLNMLAHVQSVVAVKDLQQTLLEYDILVSFSQWLRPRPDKSLPTLALRTALYELMAKLPCQSGE